MVIGENPLDFDRPGSWFQNVEFFAAMDWTETETTRFADITLPGSTFLETAGTRCNFEGEVTDFAAAVKAPFGKDGVQVLAELVTAFGINAIADIAAHIDRLVSSKLGGLVPYYWNTGQDRTGIFKGRLVAVEVDAKASSIQPPLTHSQKYRKELRDVGTGRFRVQHGH